MVLGVRLIVRMCEMCMCLARGGVDERIGSALYQSCGKRKNVGHVSVFGLRWCDVDGEWVVSLGLDLKG